ncbi:hypothetical protein D3C80_1834010 [compost metagenome]
MDDALSLFVIEHLQFTDRGIGVLHQGVQQIGKVPGDLLDAGVTEVAAVVVVVDRQGIARLDHQRQRIVGPLAILRA